MAVGEEIYSGAAQFGRFNAIIGLVFAVIISTGLIVGGIYFINQRDKITGKVSGTVLNSNCLPVENNQYSCSFDVKYIVNGKEYTHRVTRTGAPVQNNDIVNVYFDPANPDAPYIDYISKKLTGEIMLGFGILILVISIISTILTFKFKFYAAAEGAAAGIDLLRR